jgi:lipoate-protein ligase B
MTASKDMNPSQNKWLMLDLGLLDYRKAWDLQLRLVEAGKNDLLKTDVALFVEHPGVFTLGRRGGSENLKVSRAFLAGRGIDLVSVERGGDITYHGPGQLVIYPVVNLKSMGLGVLPFVESLEEIMIRTLATWGIQGERNSMNRGAWVGMKKIGSIGIAVRRSITFHGLALNVNTDLEPFTWVNPCGLHNVMITSMQQQLGATVPMEEVKQAARQNMEEIFRVSLTVPSVQELEEILGAQQAPLPSRKGL